MVNELSRSGWSKVLDIEEALCIPILAHSSFARIGGNITKIILFSPEFFSILAKTNFCHEVLQ
jgi:hypothetical protein